MTDNNKITELLKKSATHLEKDILNLDIDKLPISDYSKRYFKDYLKKLKYSLKACSFIIEESHKISGTELTKSVFVDYGGGVGILSILAKKAGIGTVIYSDIYDIACKDAETIAKSLGVDIDLFVTGDIKDLKKYTEENKIDIDIISSRNVIEHIYDLEEFFKVLSAFKSNPTLFFATTANEKNLLVDLYTKNLQKKIENEGLKGKWEKERDNIKAYKLLRKEIIKNHYPYLNEDEIEILTANTRGLVEEEIKSAVKKYVEHKQIPPAPSHPTNTCDPYTGNWAEHLVSIKEYKDLFTKNGFTFKLINGFYNTNYKIKALNLLTPFVNRLIKLVGTNGIYLAPFIVLAGKKKN